MICSSSTICTPDGSGGEEVFRRGAGGRKRSGRGLALTGLLALALLAGAGMGTGYSQEATTPEARIISARQALARGDGIKAEMELRAALEAGAERAQVAAWMGEAFLNQGNTAKARSWLEGGSFTPDTAASGWRALAQVERREGRFDSAAQAYGKALAITPANAGLWVEIGRLRYMRGQHLGAIAAADHALELDDRSVPALAFKGQLVRDRYGLVGALPWFEKALMLDSDNVPVLLEYAASLSDLGRASQAVTVTRRILELAPKNPRAYYLQAVIAARAGNFELARRLLEHTDGQLDDLPAVVQLRGIAELASGNPATAGEAFEAVLRRRPESRRTRDLLARAIYLSGEYRYLTLRCAGYVTRGEASPYMLTLVARAYEALDDRQKAGELLDAAARTRGSELRIMGGPTRIGKLLAQGRSAQAETEAEAARKADPGFYDNLSLAGDVQLALGHARSAQDRYAAAAEIRMPVSLFQRRVEAFVMADDRAGAQALVDAYLEQNPQCREALRAAADLAISAGDYPRAQAILTWMRANGSARDVQLLSDLALAEAGVGELEAAEANAREAYRLQRSSAQATQALGFVLAARGRHPHTARALFAKAEAMVGKTGLIAQGRAMLETPPRAR